MLDARGLKESPPSSHPLLTKIPACVVGYRPCIDILHTLDLGVSQRLCGSVLHTWCYQEACDKAMAPKNMREVWNRIQDKYRSMKVKERFTNIFLSQFSNTEHPWSQAPLLKGKAAEIRHLVPVLASVAWDKCHGNKRFERKPCGRMPSSFGYLLWPRGKCRHVHDSWWIECSSAGHAELLATLCVAARTCGKGLLVPAGTQISLGIPFSSDVQVPKPQNFLDLQARILGRQHGNYSSFLQPWNQKHKAFRKLLWKVSAGLAAQAQSISGLQ